jgi:hypothetical protein
MRQVRAGFLLIFITIGLLLSGCSSTTSHSSAGIFVAPLGPYGDADNYPANSTFTDGNTILEITKGPVRILSVEFQDSGSKPAVLGIWIRPLSPTIIPYDSANGYPPTAPSAWQGAIKADGATLNGPIGDQPHADFELLIGYRMAASGRYSRSAVIIRYQYAGRTATLIHPSWLDLCVGNTHSLPCPTDAITPSSSSR